MIQRKIEKLDNQYKEFFINVNPENPFVRVSMKAIHKTDGLNEITSSIILTHFNKKGVEIKKSIIDLLEWPIEFSDPLIDKTMVQLCADEENQTAYNFEIQLGKDLIDVSNPVKEFEDHLLNPVNARILFSAPFGMGKTTFLNVFFDLKKEDYEVFKVFPVNYSVANNDDIFRYIKTDILFQLLEKDIEWDATELSKSQAIAEYLFLNPKKVIANFIKMIVSLDKRADTIVNLLPTFKDLLVKIKEYKKDQEFDDRNNAISYIEELFEIEGSLFEDDLYTQLIRQLLERIKETDKKENVLIIEDLDRMDPDHIFRILNVISAHYDTFQNAAYNEANNKFGFDKIIVVCHQQNIKSIFHHKYGDNTDFNGYFNKYFSSKPFDFNNTENVKTYLRNYYFDGTKNEKIDAFSKAHNVILEAMLLVGAINHRELAKIDRNFDTYRAPDSSQYSNYTRNFQDGLFYKSISFLSEKMGVTRLEEIIKELKRKNIDTKRQFDYYTKCLIPMTLEGKEKFTNESIIYEIIYTHDSNKEFSILDPPKNKPFTTLFNHTDFYNYLLQVFEKYKHLFLP